MLAWVSLVLLREEQTVAQEYEQSQAIDAPPDEVFAWLSDVGNLPEYLPPVVDSSVEGPSAEGLPGQRIRTTLEYPGGDGGTFEAEGYFAVDERERRMEWGAESGRDYSGWLTVANRGEEGSEVVVHLSFGERSAEPEIEEQTPEGEHPLADGISATLESIRRQIEEGSGKVEAPPPPEGVEPPLEENPAVVNEETPHKDSATTNEVPERFANLSGRSGRLLGWPLVEIADLHLLVVSAFGAGEGAYLSGPVRRHDGCLVPVEDVAARLAPLPEGYDRAPLADDLAARHLCRHLASGRITRLRPYCMPILPRIAEQSGLSASRKPSMTS